jgi:hypothetical protein
MLPLVSYGYGTSSLAQGKQWAYTHIEGVDFFGFEVFTAVWVQIVVFMYGVRYCGPILVTILTCQQI